MTLRLVRNITIENPRNFPGAAVERLRTLLSGGTCVQADTRRANFFEIHNSDDHFWIHVSPISGHVVLLAAWEHNVPTTTAVRTRAA